MKGIDVSHWTGKIDWKAVKEDGIDFVMAKASQGSPLSNPKGKPFKDEHFDEYITGAGENGIYCGAYHYLTGTTEDEVKREAEYFVSVLEKHRERIVFPCACDIEEARYKALPKSMNSKLYLTFAKIVKEAGFIPILYTNTSFLKSYYDIGMLDNVEIWFARYKAIPSPEPKPDIEGMAMYQWNPKGIVKGINGTVDLDISYRDYASEAITVGSTVMIKNDAEYYWEGGPLIPARFRGESFGVKQTESKNKKVFKGGKECVLLDRINTWINTDLLYFIK